MKKTEMKIICFGVRDYEIPVFKKIEKKYNCVFELSSLYIDDTNYSVALGYEVIILRANCFLSDNSLLELKENGLKYLLTRTIGYNHIPLEVCHNLEIQVAYAPGYSPSSIAELGVTLALNIIRNVPEAIMNSANYDFQLNSFMYGREIRECTVGILGCGTIGKETARLYSAMGAKVYGYDIVQDESMLGTIEYCSIDKIYEEADIISIHLSYNEKKNWHFVGKEEFDRMKKNVVIINTARGPLLDTEALIDAIKAGKVLGAGLDVIEYEKGTFFRSWTDEEMHPTIKKLVDLYPRVIITPHISSSTDVAVYDSMRITMENLYQLINNVECKNLL